MKKETGLIWIGLSEVKYAWLTDCSRLASLLQWTIPGAITSPEDRLGENCLTPAQDNCSKFKTQTKIKSRMKTPLSKCSVNGKMSEDLERDQ